MQYNILNTIHFKWGGGGVNRQQAEALFIIIYPVLQAVIIKYLEEARELGNDLRQVSEGKAFRERSKILVNFCKQALNKI